jgi:hypothetical protein
MRSAKPNWARFAIAVPCLAALSVCAGKPASAAGLLDFLFGGYRSAPRAASSPVPYPSMARFATVRGRSAKLQFGASVAYCVRLCDGRYFPMLRTAQATPVEMCNAFCPASTTKVFSGSPIERAVASDGTRYDDLDNAFAYRKKISPDCTCNGHDLFGNALMDISSDPTLRTGDLISTRDGLVPFAGNAEPTVTGDITGSLPRGMRGQFGAADDTAAEHARGTIYRLLP